MPLSSSIWKTSSSIPTTFPSTKLMFGKYSDDSALTDFLPVQTNASSTSLPANTSDTCCHLKVSPWPLTRSRLSKIGPNLGKSRMFNPSSVLPISTIVPFTDTLKSQFCLRVLPARVPPGTFPMSAIQPLKHFSNECRSAFEALKKAFTTAPVLTHWIPDTQITVETDASD